VLAVITLIRDPGAFRALPRHAWPSLLAASAATATFQATFLTSAARTGAAVATAVTFGIAPVSTGLCERIMLGTRLPRHRTAATLSLAEPLVATTLGIDILRERLSLPIAAGALLLLGGLVLVSVARPRAGSRRRAVSPASKTASSLDSYLPSASGAGAVADNP
jgi:drug/metabolite transporter (DMT)-like permease